jgi:hypothetical protein
MSSGIPGLPRPPIDARDAAIRELQRKVADLGSATTRRGDSISLTARTADIATTNLITAARNALYRVTAVLQCTTVDALATVLTLTISWTDRVGATNDTVTRIQTVTGRNALHTVLQVQGDTPITYAVAATTHGNAIYAVEIRLERIT